MVLDANLSFERFVVGPSNELAASAARRAAEAPGSVYNPLVICGGSGVGKTHLLHAIGQYALTLDADMAVHLEPADLLVQRISHGIASGDLTAVAESLIGLDLLLIDDIERLSDLERTQEELAAIIDLMTNEGRQIVLTSSMSPMELPGFLPVFKRVLGRGVVVDLSEPDEETRRLMAERAARVRGRIISKDVQVAIASYGFSDYRTISSIVERVLEFASEQGRLARPSDVKKVLELEAQPEPVDEFGSFVDDVSRTLAAVVETAPWRRRLAEAILKWEGEGIRTHRLEEALLADSAPDVDSLIEWFSREATRLLHVRRDLQRLGVEDLPDDPEQVARAEAVLAALQSGQPVPSEEALSANGNVRSAHAAEGPEEVLLAAGLVPRTTDPWFFNHGKLVLTWTDLEGRIVEDPR